MKRGDIWWVEFEPAVGSDIRQTRPAVIVSNDSANRHLSRVVAGPLNSNADRIYPGKAIIKMSEKESKAMTDQIMAADKSRLKNLLGSLSKKDMLAVENAIKTHLALPL